MRMTPYNPQDFIVNKGIWCWTQARRLCIPHVVSSTTTLHVCAGHFGNGYGHCLCKPSLLRGFICLWSSFFPWSCQQTQRSPCISASPQTSYHHSLLFCSPATSLTGIRGQNHAATSWMFRGLHASCFFHHLVRHTVSSWLNFSPAFVAIRVKSRVCAWQRRSPPTFCERMLTHDHGKYCYTSVHEAAVWHTRQRK